MKRVTIPRPLAEPDEAAGHLLKAQTRLGHPQSGDDAAPLRPRRPANIADSIDDMLTGVGTSLQ